VSYPPPRPPAPHAPPPPAATADPRWPRLPDGWWRGTRPESTFPVPFSIGDAIGLLAWFLLGQAIVGFPMFWLVELLGGDVSQMRSAGALAAVVLTQTLVIVGGLGYLRLRGRLDWRTWGPIRPAWSHVGWGILVGLGGFFVIQLAVGLLIRLLGEPEPPEQALLQAVGSDPVVTTLVVLAAVVLAPVGEELFFRGFLFQALRRRVGLWPSAFMSSALFGVVHIEVIDPAAIPALLVAVALLCLAVVPRFPLVVRLVLGALGLAALAFAVAAGGWVAVLVPGGLAALGFVFALAFHRTGNLLVPIVGHAVFNGVVLGLTLLARSMDLTV
jgi:uncharacterized protein